MKKYSILFALIALVVASLACQTVMGGGENDFEVPDVPNATAAPDDSGELPTVPPVTTDGDGNITVGGDSKFPVVSDAFNVITAPDVLTYQTKLSTDDVLKFYRDEFSRQGYEEDTSLAITFGKTFTLAFTGDASGKVVYVVGADAGDGSTYITVTLAQ